MPSRTSIEPLAARPSLGTASTDRGLSHVAIIMDGNRRWARSRGMPPVFAISAAPKRSGGPWRAAASTTSTI